MTKNTVSRNSLLAGKFLFLGTSASAGVPVIGCKCEICSSPSPYNKRLRPSGLITIQDKSLLIDIGPDFREQALKYHINTLDGLLLSHTHYDHIAGIDELRIFYVRQNKPFPCLMSQETSIDLQKRYDYLFKPIEEKATLSARLDLQILPTDMGQVFFLGLPISYCHFFQGGMKVTGFRIGNFAYLSDIRDYPSEIFSFLKGVQTLVLSSLSPKPSRVHFSFAEAIAFAKQAGVEKTFLTHLGHFIDHDLANAMLPSDVQLGYDGLELKFTWVP